MEHADLAIVILNWNGRNFLERFLPAVIAYSQPYRIIVADNNSSDDSVDFLRNNFPEVELIINDVNGGFAKGYNDALKKVNAEFYLLLNSDVEVTEGWLDPLLEVMKNPKVAGCQPKIKAWDRRDEFEHAGASGGYMDHYYYPFCRGRIFDAIEKDHGQYDHEADIFWATGACMLIRSSVYWEAGALDERFFAHMEEIDLCWRAQRMGYSFKAVPSSVVFHVGGGTLSYMSPQKTFLNFRNSLLMIHKNHPGFIFWMMFRRLSLDGMAALHFLSKGQFRHFWAVLKSHVSYYWLFPTSVKERRKYKHLKNKASVGKYRGSVLYAKFIQKTGSFEKLNQRLMEND